MKRLFLITLLLFLGHKTFALEIVYPKKNNVQINSKSTFFIGNSKSPVTINNNEVSTVQDGGFAYVVPLKIGENIFTIKSGNETLKYKITRSKPANYTPPQLIEYSGIDYIVKNDGASLRTSPVDGGVNRLSQLPKGTKLIVNGEKGNFFRVKLSDTETGWILKSDAEETDELLYINIKNIKQLRCRKDKEFMYYRFKLSDKIPFSVLNQNENLVLKFYDTDVSLEISKQYGFNYYYDNFGHFVLKVRYKIPEKPTITIDAGHGGVELGAIGCCGDREKDINLKISQYLKKELENDFHVVMTREEDKKVSLQDRVNLAKENNSTVLVSIHSNALPDGEDPNKNRGTSVYYYHNQAKPLAENILYEITTQTGTNNDKVRQRSLALARPSQCMSVLIEVAYMINPYDNMMLTDEQFQKDVAKSISDGIRNYFAKL